MATYTYRLLTRFYLVLVLNILSRARMEPIPAHIDIDMGSMMQRLKLDEEGPGSANCWASLLELQACTGEVIQFFYDGETYLGPACCRAIQVIEHHCWPNMLTSLGFTSEEGDILRGYCDSEDEDHHSHQTGA